MKAISLWQPWATLVVIGAKTIETRSWATSYRGLLVIHAAKRTEDLEYWFEQPYFEEVLTEEGYTPDNLPLGAALGIVDLVEIFTVEEIRERIPVEELAFGNYDDGRKAWQFANPRQFVEPVPMKGAQGLFYPPSFVMPLIR